MTDNPLADYLRARQAALGQAEEAESVGTAADAGGPVGPAGAEEVGAPNEAGEVCWDRPPQDGDDHPPRRRRLVLIAALPWMVAAVLGGVALATGEVDPVAVDAGGQDADGQDADGPPAAGHTPHPGVPVDPALGAAAAVAVRLAVTTSGDLPDGQARRYVDLAVPESVSWAGDLAVVTVRAVVLEGPADHWRSARPARFAVPVRLVDGDPVVLDEPWALPVPDHPAPAPGWTPASTAPDPIAEAAGAAGYTDTEVVEVAAHPDHPTLLRARIQARAPDEQGHRAHQLWLQAAPEPAVLGLEPRPTQDDGRRP